MQVDRTDDRTTVVVYRSNLPWMLIWANGLHFGWAILLIFWTDASINRLVVLIGLEPLIDIGLSRVTIGIIIFTAALLSTLGILLDYFHRITIGHTIALLFLQYAILNIAILSDTIVYLTGEYRGDSVARTTIFGILWPLWFAAVCHSGLIIERYILPWVKQWVKLHYAVRAAKAAAQIK